MNPGLPVTAIDDFVVLAGRSSDPAAAARSQALARSTTEILAKAGDFQPRGTLSGSFIYAHPPDYRGRPSLHFDVAAWRAVFREFKEIGIDTAIWQASAWLEFEECYYPSKQLAGFKQWNVVEPMLEAARAESMTVYLGTLGFFKGELALGIRDGDIRKAQETARLELACFRELRDLYGGGFQGYYVSHEVAYWPGRPPHVYKHGGAYFERLTAGIKEMEPELRILASPETYYSKGREQESVDCMMETFSRAQIDIFAPMDCIGQMQQLDTLETELGVWKEVSRAKGSEFWVNCESFLIADPVGAVIRIEAAEPARFLYQMTVADKMGARKLITWEAMHFMDPAGEPKARALGQAYRDYYRHLPKITPSQRRGGGGAGCRAPACG